MYTEEIKKLCIKIYNKIKSLRKVECLTNVSKSTISRWNSCKENVIKNNKNKIPLIIDAIRIVYKMNIYFTIKDVIDYVKKKMNINVSYKLVRCLLIKDMNLSYKKCKYSNYVNENKLKLKTIEFHNLFKKQYNTDSLLVSIDEIGFSKRLNPLYSWSVRGKTKYIKNKIVSVKNRNISVCSCITSNGDIKYEISNKPFNRESFLSFLQNLNFPKGTILLIDNVSFHHSKIVKEYITKKGWISLYTPPYSPWFNPIENIFGIIKNQYRKNKNISISFSYVNHIHIIKTINSTTNKILNNFYL
uniref:Tc1-like transposase DDE domain-containing protein n=1 Tax=viral metagenome TaxID=1070528 RepID=A0A6C0E1T8_9ZZZZ